MVFFGDLRCTSCTTPTIPPTPIPGQSRRCASLTQALTQAPHLPDEKRAYPPSTACDWDSRNASSEWDSSRLAAQEAKRTLYFGNLPPTVSFEAFLNHIHGGMVEHVKILHDKQCAFVTFLHQEPAMALFQESQFKKLVIQGYDVRVGNEEFDIRYSKY